MSLSRSKQHLEKEIIGQLFFLNWQWSRFFREDLTLDSPPPECYHLTSIKKSEETESSHTEYDYTASRNPVESAVPFFFEIFPCSWKFSRRQTFRTPNCDKKTMGGKVPHEQLLAMTQDNFPAFVK